MTAITHDTHTHSTHDQNMSMNVRMALTMLNKKGTYISNQLGMHRAVFSTRMTNETRWTLEEAAEVGRILGVGVDVLLKDPRDASPELFDALRTGSLRPPLVLVTDGT